MTHNCALHCNNYVRSTFKARQGNDLYFQVTGDMWLNFELVFPSRDVVRVDWFSVGWIILVGELFLPFISINYKCSVQQLLL